MRPILSLLRAALPERANPSLVKARGMAEQIASGRLSQYAAVDLHELVSTPVPELNFASTPDLNLRAAIAGEYDFNKKFYRLNDDKNEGVLVLGDVESHLWAVTVTRQNDAWQIDRPYGFEARGGEFPPNNASKFAKAIVTDRMDERGAVAAGLLKPLPDVKLNFGSITDIADRAKVARAFTYKHDFSTFALTADPNKGVAVNHGGEGGRFITAAFTKRGDEWVVGDYYLGQVMA